MNSTFGIWLIGAGVAAVALLLLLGAPAAAPDVSSEPEAAGDVVVAEADGAAATPTYWEPVTVSSTAPAVVSTASGYVSTVGTATACGSCGSTARASAPTTPVLAGGCGVLGGACGSWGCPACSRQTAVTAVGSAPRVGGCAVPSTPCGGTVCNALAGSCYDTCADPCRALKPGINRNMPLCVDECSFLQLHSTVSHPICDAVRFEWSASKGWFLDSTASDPLYFAPTTQFCDGEDVWITLLVTDPSGNQYSDVVSLHVRDLP